MQNPIRLLAFLSILSLGSLAQTPAVNYWMLMHPGKLDTITWKRGPRWSAGTEQQAIRKGFLKVEENLPGHLKLSLKNQGSDCYYRSAKLTSQPLTDDFRFTGKLSFTATEHVTVRFGVLFRHPGIDFLGNLPLAPTAHKGDADLYSLPLKPALAAMVKNPAYLSKTTIEGWYLAISTPFDHGKTFKDGASVSIRYDLPTLGRPAETLVYQEAFKDPKGFAANWHPVSGTWKLQNGGLYGEGNAVIFLKRKASRNLVLEYKCQAVGEPGDLSAVLCANSMDANWNRNAYFYGFGTFGNSMNRIMRNGLQLTRSMMEGFKDGITPGKIHQVRMEKNGSQLKMTVDGKILLDYKDAYHMEMKGEYVGLYVFTAGFFYDVRLLELNSDNELDELPLDLKPDIKLHDGINQESAWSLNQATVVNHPTWIYDWKDTSEKTVDDPCLEIRGQATRTLPPVSVGLLDVDLFVETFGSRGVELTLLNASGQSMVTFLIDAQGVFYLETPQGMQKLNDHIEYRRRYCSTTYTCNPRIWNTFRLIFDTTSGYVRQCAVMNLYPEFKNTLYRRTAFDQGDIHILGDWIPCPRMKQPVTALRVKTADGTVVRFDNLCLLSPVGTAMSNGMDLRNPARVLMDLDFPPRKDPFDIMTTTLHNLTGKRAKSRFSAWGIHSGPSYDYIWHDPSALKDPNVQAFKREAMRYNQLLMGVIFAEERNTMLNRTAYYRPQDSVLQRQVKKHQALLEQAFKQLQDAFAAYGEAFVDGRSLTRLQHNFVPAAQHVTNTLQELKALNTAIITALPPPPAGMQDTGCPITLPEGNPTWSPGKGFTLNGRPAIKYMWNDETQNRDIFKVLAGSLTDRNGKVPNQIGTETIWGHDFKPGETLPSQWMNTRFNHYPNYGIWAWDGTHAGNFHVPAWWIREHEQDPDIFWRTRSGAVHRGNYYNSYPEAAHKFRHAGLNFWNPAVREFIRDKYESFGKWVADNQSRRSVEYLDLAGEMQFNQNMGVNASAERQFQQSLQKRFKSIQALNAAWQTAYQDFQHVRIPLKLGPPSPLQYEFQRFRQEGYASLTRLQVQSVRKHTNRVPLGNDFQDIFGGDFDMPLLFEVNDYISFHTYHHKPWKIINRWLDSLNKVYHKPIFDRETGMSQGCPEMFQETAYRNWTLARDFHKLMWGRSMAIFDVGDKMDDWTYCGHSADPRTATLTLRYSKGSTAIALDRAYRVGSYALESTSIDPDVILLEPTASVLNAEPHGIIRSLMHSIALNLEDQGIIWGTAYEQLLLDGRQNLTHAQTVIVPNGVCMPLALQKLLMEFVSKGGTLLAIAPLGVYDQYGLPSSFLLKHLFSDTTWKESLGGWEVSGSSPQPDGSCTAKLGKGIVKVWCSSTDFKSPVTWLSAHHRHTCYAQNRKLEIAIRTTPQQDTYLYVLNGSLNQAAEDRIVLQQAYSSAYDLNLMRPVAVPLHQEDGHSYLNMKLAPAEGTLIKLIR